MTARDRTFRKRSKALRRMCILSAMMSLTSIASLIVGIMAVQTADAKFPFNTGGAIIAGIMCLLFSVCPMCMYSKAAQHDMLSDSLDKGCCSWALFFWGFLTLLGIPFGLAVNGIVAVNACVHPSEETGCTKNADTKMILAIVTIILTIILMVLTVLIYVTCCCSICKELNDTSTYDIYESELAIRRQREQNSISRISNINQLAEMSHGITNSRFSNADSNHDYYSNANSNSDYYSNDNSNIIEPTAPPRYREPAAPPRYREPAAPPGYWSNTVIEGGTAGELSARTGHRSSPLGHGQADEGPGYTHIYEDPPPTYYEVMENDPMETPL